MDDSTESTAITTFNYICMGFAYFRGGRGRVFPITLLRDFFKNAPHEKPANRDIECRAPPEVEKAGRTIDRRRDGLTETADSDRDRRGTGRRYKREGETREGELDKETTRKSGLRGTGAGPSHNAGD